jgi:hypothetical protein
VFALEHMTVSKERTPKERTVSKEKMRKKRGY